MISRLQDRLTLGQQISIMIAGITFIGLAAVALFAADLSRREMVERIKSDMAATAGGLADRLESDLLERYTDIRQLSQMQPLNSVWEASPSLIRTVLDQLQIALPSYAWIGFARPDGTVVAATRGMLEDASVAARPWFTEGLKGPFLGDVHEAVLLSKLLDNTTTGEPRRFVDVAFPVYSGDRRLLGVLGAHLAFEWVDSLRLGALKAKPSIDIWVLSQGGEILLGPTLPAPPFSPARIAAMEQEASGVFVDDTARDGQVLTGFSVVASDAMPPLGWIIVARQNARAAFAAPSRVAGSIVVLGLLVMVLSVGSATWLTARLSRPLSQLTQAAGEIGRTPDVVMLPRLRGSLDVMQLSGALRALLRRLGSVETRFVEATQRQEQDIAALRELADTDPLTGLLNRRSFLSVAESTLHGTRSTDNVGILMADIDHFKRVNDTHGHAAGDAVIRYVSAHLMSGIRSHDRVARFGGEEFVVMLMAVNKEDMLALADRIRTSIAAGSVAFEGKTIQVTISFGAALAQFEDRDVDAVIERADLALYEAKDSGRNRVAFADRSTRVTA